MFLETRFCSVETVSHDVVKVSGYSAEVVYVLRKKTKNTLYLLVVIYIYRNVNSSNKLPYIYLNVSSENSTAHRDDAVVACLVDNT